MGAGFSLEIVDLNKDGNNDVMVINHTHHNQPDPQDAVPSSVFGYEIPTDYQSADWTRHTLLTGLQTLKGGFGQASPGHAVHFYPGTDESGRPWIHVDGDGAMNSYVLEPIVTVPETDPEYGWEYNEHIVLELENSITGQAAVKDVNGDGWKEIFEAAFDMGKIYIFTFAPETPAP